MAESGYDDSGRKTFQCAEALAHHRQVKLVAGTARDVNYADAAEDRDVLGVVEYAAADNAQISVTLTNKQGTQRVTASGVIAVNGMFKAAADGKIQAVGTSATEPCLGKVLEAAGADGDIIEVWYFGTCQIRDLS